VSFDLRRPRQTIFGQTSELLIGELLLKSGVIKQHQLDEALKLAGNKHMQIGQMLIMARYITQPDLQAAIDAQVALRDRILDMNGALKALSVAHRSHITFAQASQQHSSETALVPIHKLGQILLEANLINAAQLSVAVQKSMATGLPVGRILILNNVITEVILAAALEVLIKMRDGNVGREEAVAYLSDVINTKAVDDLGVAVLEEASLYNAQQVVSTRKSMRLGEFLVLSGILSETDIMNALEFSLVGEKPLGEALLEHGYITRHIMDSALKLQSLIESDTLDAQKAAQCLNIIHVNSISLTEAMERVTSAKPDGSLLEFRTMLVDSQLLTNEDIDSGFELAAKNPRVLAQILTQTGYLKSAQANILVECHEAITQNIITQHDAKFVLDFCLQKLVDGHITFTEGLQELGWSKINEGAATSEGATEQAVSNAAPETNKFSNQSGAAPGAFLGMPGAINQSFIQGASISSPNQIPNQTPNQTPNHIPDPQSHKSERHTGRTTTNMPAITNLQAGSELYPTSSDEESESDSSETEDQSFCLKNLLQEDDSGHDPSASMEDLINQNRNTNLEDLELSDSEKALIIKASSLTASPQEIMAAMKLAAKKEKTIRPDDKNKNSEEKGKQ
jgi:hypothetical protein